jgi:hypothetical protein
MRELTSAELEAVSGGGSLRELVVEVVVETATNGEGGRELGGFLKKWPLQI